MNLALVILHADPARGGAERYTLDLSAALAARGHSVSLLATTFAPSVPTVVQRVELSTPARTRVGRYNHFLNALDRHLHQQPYDVVHAMLPVRRCNVYHPHAGIAAAAVAGGSTVSRWGNLLNRRRHRMAAVERTLLTAAHPPITLCLSNYVMATVRDFYPHLAPDRLVRLFNGIDLARFDPATRLGAGQQLRQQLSIPPQAVVALMLAQDFERKGLPQTLAALAQVPNLFLLVAGKQDPRPYQRQAQSLGVADRVRFAGPTADPYAFYQASDFFVLPTRHDPCSLVVLEALVMGLPVITTVYNGASEAMTQPQHGIILTDPTDVPSLAAALNRLAQPGQGPISRAACLALRPALSQTAHVDALENIYRRIAASPAPPIT